MDLSEKIFGSGEDLTIVQMSMRALVAFLICLLLVRISGRRSFGMRMPVDNVTTILLGAILSRAVVGASPFFSTVAAATTLAVLHRLFGWLGFYSRVFGKVIKGTEIILYCDGKFHEKNMRYGMVSKRDILSQIRLTGNMDSFDDVDCIYLERDGKISVIKKKNKSNG
jgi:uncharacterized membrane protein YcaP (DUF421 family)